MVLETDFTVAAPPERVWAELLDLEQLGACLPGSAMARVNGDQTLQGELRPEIAGTPLACVGTLRPVDVDEDGRSASCALRVRQNDGPAFATALLRARVEDAGGGGRVSMALDGRLAAIEIPEERVRGEAERLLGELASNLERSLTERARRPAPATAAPASAPQARQPAPVEPLRHPEPAPAGGAAAQVPAPVAAGAVGLIALLLAVLFGRRSRRRSAWFEIRYRW
jgi:uncharacterized protein